MLLPFTFFCINTNNLLVRSKLVCDLYRILFAHNNITCLNMSSTFNLNKIKNKNYESSEIIVDLDCIPFPLKNVIVVVIMDYIIYDWTKNSSL